MKKLQKLFAAAIAATMMTGALAAQLTYDYVWMGNTVTDTIVMVDGVWKKLKANGTYGSVNQDGITAILDGTSLSAVTVTSRTDIEGYLDWALGDPEPVPEVTTPEPVVTAPVVPATPVYMTGVTVAQAQVFTNGYINDAAKLVNQKSRIEQQLRDMETNQNAYFGQSVNPADIQMVRDALANLGGEIQEVKVQLKADRDALVNIELRRRHLAGEVLKQEGSIDAERYDFDYVERTAFDFTDFTQSTDVKSFKKEIADANNFKMVRYGEYQESRDAYSEAVELFLNGTYTLTDLQAIETLRNDALARFIRAGKEHRDAVRDLENAVKLQGYSDIADANAGLFTSSFNVRSSVTLAGRTDIDTLVANSHWIEDTDAQAAWDAGFTGAGQTITIFDRFDDENADTHGRRVAQIAGGIDEDFGTVGIAAEANIIEYNAVLSGVEDIISAAQATGASIINVSMGGYDGFDATETVANADTVASLFVISSGNDQHKDCRAIDSYAECNALAAQFLVGADSSDLAEQTIVVGQAKTFNEGGSTEFSFNLGTNAGDLMDHYMVADGTAAAGKGGSSFAAPRVAGAAALVMQQQKQINADAHAADSLVDVLSREELAIMAKNILLNTATDLGTTGTDEVFGRGKLNLLEALSM